jgi:hypothetical protein
MATPRPRIRAVSFRPLLLFLLVPLIYSGTSPLVSSPPIPVAMPPPDDPICASVQAAPVGSGEGRLPAASRRAKAARPPRDRPCRRTRPPRPPPVPRCFSLSFGKLQASFRAGFSCPCRGYQNWIISSDATSLIHCFGHHCVSDKSRMLLLVENLSSCL